MSVALSGKLGKTSTVTVDVCVRPLLSVAGTRCTRWTPASLRNCSYAPGVSISRIASWSGASEPFGSDVPSAASYVNSLALRPWLAQYTWYMRSKSPAKSAASDPPAPGLISRRHGRSEKGCFGTRENVKALQADSSCFDVCMISSDARERNSASVVGSARRFLSSVRDCSCQKKNFYMKEYLYLARLLPFFHCICNWPQFAYLSCCFRLKAFSIVRRERRMLRSECACTLQKRGGDAIVCLRGYGMRLSKVMRAIEGAQNTSTAHVSERCHRNLSCCPRFFWLAKRSRELPYRFGPEFLRPGLCLSFTNQPKRDQVATKNSYA